MHSSIYRSFILKGDVMLSMKDRLQLATWLNSKASYNEVVNCSRIGIAENERFSERAREVFIFLWSWAAPRFSGKAGIDQDAIYSKYGMKALNRRYARINRIIQSLK